MFLLLSCATPGPSPESAVLDADRERIGAMVAGDQAWLSRILHEDLVYTHSNGVVDSRESLITSLASGGLDYRSIAPSDREVVLHRDTAILSATARIVVRAGEQQLVLDSAYTAVYMRDDGWRLVAYHSSPREK